MKKRFKESKVAYGMPLLTKSNIRQRRLRISNQKEKKKILWYYMKVLGVRIDCPLILNQYSISLSISMFKYKTTREIVGKENIYFKVFGNMY